jgi:hypothetical protein
MLMIRLKQSGDNNSQKVYYVDPQEAALAFEGDSSQKQEATEMWRAELGKLSKTGRLLVVAPDHGGGHWAVLVWMRQEDLSWQLQFHDSIGPSGTVACRVKAEQYVETLSPLLGSITPLGQTVVKQAQADSWSCGLYVYH